MAGVAVKLMVLVALVPLEEGEAVFVMAVMALYMEVEAEAAQLVALLPVATEDNMVVVAEEEMLVLEIRPQEESAVNMVAREVALTAVRLSGPQEGQRLTNHDMNFIL